MTRNHGGFDLRLHIADGLGEKWYDRDVPSKPEIDFLRSFRLGPGASVFNLGAHQAIHAIILAKIVGKNGLVVAVEPSAHNVAVGERNRELNDVGQLRLLQAAASDRSGTLVLSEGLNAEVQVDSRHRLGATTVPSLSVDDLSRDYGLPDVIFVDVEGFECRVLSGARRTLSTRPDWFIEVHVNELAKYGNSVPELLSCFDEREYEFFVSENRVGSPEGSQFKRFRPTVDALPEEARWFLIVAGIRSTAD